MRVKGRSDLGQRGLAAVGVTSAGKIAGAAGTSARATLRKHLVAGHAGGRGWRGAGGKGSDAYVDLGHGAGFEGIVELLEAFAHQLFAQSRFELLHLLLDGVDLLLVADH